MKEMLILIQEFGPVVGLLLFMVWKDIQAKAATKTVTPTSDKLELMIQRVNLTMDRVEMSIKKEDVDAEDNQ